MLKIKYWLWHIIGILTICDLSTEEVIDKEYEKYNKFMEKHGFNLSRRRLLDK